MTLREVLRASLRLLTRRDRRLLGLAMLAQIATALLDLLGIILIGLVGALSVSAMQGQPPQPRITSAISTIGLGSLSQTTLIATLGAAAAILLLTKSVIGPLLISRVLEFLAQRGVDLSWHLTRDLLSRPLTFVQRRSTQETAVALLGGADAATVVVLGQMVIAAAEAALLTTVAVVLLIVNPPLAVGGIAFFGLVGFVLQRTLGQRAERCGAERIRAEIASLRAAQEALGSYREISVADRREFYVDRIRGLRSTATRASTEQQFIGILPKYVSEAALVLGAFALAATLFTTQSITLAAGTFVLFLAAATRAMPSLLRLQGAALNIRGAVGSAAHTFALAKDLGHPVAPPPASGEPSRQVLHGRHPDFVPDIELVDVSFTYPGSNVPAIQGLSLTVGAGDSVALVGASGAGKSTLADLILGVLDPDVGTVSVGGVPPGTAVRRWQGSLAYVPQHVMLANDSVRNNVAMGLSPENIDDDRVWDALRRARLAEYVHDQPHGLDAQIGERGLRLSGGQRQRLGVARALFTCPRLIVLDEATSALDASTEEAITVMLDELEGDVTTVIVAHRLSTVRNAAIVVYLQDGKKIAVGTFEEVCSQVPALRRQAELMGLRPA